MTFPKDFLWGASTSSYQVEGGIENNDWAEAAREGRVPEAGLACDHYNRFEEDFDIAKSLGHSAHRFSIEWARIEPEEGVFDEKELDHYKAVVAALRARGIEPFVTIWHWTMPTWLSEKGGITYKEWPELLARYAARVAEHLGDDVTFYITINEPMVVTGVGYLAGTWPPFRKNLFAYLRSVSHVISGHIKSYAAIKNIAPHTKIGVSKNIIPFHGSNPVGTIFAAIGSWWYNNRYLNHIKGFQDFIAVNHYFDIVFWENKKKKATYPKSDFGWKLSPLSMYTSLLSLKKYTVPVYVTEHGLADAEDTYRAWFIEESLKGVEQAINEGVDVRGYMHWSLLDNYEWAEGYTMRFGLVHVDHEGDRERTIRESAKRYAEIIAKHANE
ncbi:MAG: glycoside hydrolase family 1 protein [Patescibacteria group bacterium UBA2163]